ncbi:RNA polymerase sigma-70 factor, ECF subfamily [Parafrankia irregularis]|uniref:RNA polymerase sigma-70 factor, ECF subfamily n=1 Tax=Parafrankia irregularis TaxID=795642 RepID=A0A0S4QJ92_9ACTN|nr:MULTISPECIES: sigma-70 family RNA polymerase sigma factor [Frankiaceae]EFC80352.1 RNA polymerase, sigma-24 subunit, ECF subfamily [Parafrankia sp. EUN1f]KPM57173.1 RNA polymerase subunit sigma24 [Frankia sp. R43]MBE3205487.1 sigma-70 family RNA polymerase sigma factor [Parafrankia sp. CH37]CUU55617.1 RNA polymerase sigma-70 factor, ECF subfamily [Parafrankia irregularis]
MTQISGDDIESPNQEPARQVPDEAGALTDVDQPFSGDRWSLVLPHRERLVHIARRRLPSTADAEDCAQEALVRAAGFRNLDSHRVGQFLTTTVLRLCVDHHRARMRADRAMARSVAAPSDPGPEDSTCDRAEALWLLDQTRRLRGRERQIMMARAAGRTTRQAADDLSISVKAAEGAFTRGRARLLAASRV